VSEWTLAYRLVREQLYILILGQIVVESDDRVVGDLVVVSNEVVCGSGVPVELINLLGDVADG